MKGKKMIDRFHSTRALNQLLGTMLVVLRAPRQRRDERGLSQSTENAILLAGAVAIAMMVIAVLQGYIQAKLPK